MDHLSHRRFVRLVRQALTISAQEGLDDCHASLLGALEAIPPPEVHDPRHVARKLGSFTTAELQDRLGVSRPSAGKAVRKMLTQGIVRDTGLRRKHDGPGRPTTVYEYVPAGKGGPLPAKQVPVEVEAARQMPAPPPRGKPVAGTRKRRITDPEMRALVDAARKDGCTITSTGSGHIHVKTPDGKTVSLPFTPSDHRSFLNCRAELRRAGVNV